MKAKSKNIVKFDNGGDLNSILNAIQAGSALTPWGAGINAAIGLGRGIFGVVQQNRAKSELEKLNEQRPEIRIPAAIMKLAEEPIAEDIVQAQQDAARRRTSQAIGAAGAMGSRSLLGALPTVVDQERIGERDRMAKYAQAERDALSMLGSSQQGMQDRQTQQWQNQVAGSRAELNAGNQNVYGGLTDIGRSLPYLKNYINPDTSTEITQTETVDNPMGSVSDTVTTEQSNDQSGMYDTSYLKINPAFTEGDKSNNVLDNLRVRFNPSTGQYEKYNEGGMITKGKFSHKENPIDIVDKEGDKVGEMTGNEVILNPEQAKMVAKESPSFKRLLKIFKKK